jgi:hypothetical protein
MPADVTVHVEGLVPLRNALRLVEPTLQKKLRTRFKAVADEVAGKVRSMMPRRSGKAADSVRGGASTTTAYVITGKKSTAPYAAWLDFGGTLHPVGQRMNTQVRPRVKGGRYMYPAIAAMQPKTERAALRAIEETAHELGLK